MRVSDVIFLVFIGSRNGVQNKTYEYQILKVFREIGNRNIANAASGCGERPMYPCDSAFK